MRFPYEETGSTARSRCLIEPNRLLGTEVGLGVNAQVEGRTSVRATRRAFILLGLLAAGPLLGLGASRAQAQCYGYGRGYGFYGPGYGYGYGVSPRGYYRGGYYGGGYYGRPFGYSYGYYGRGYHHRGYGFSSYGGYYR
jgi:hypothetical protein